MKLVREWERGLAGWIFGGGLDGCGCFWSRRESKRNGASGKTQMVFRLGNVRFAKKIHIHFSAH